MSNHRTALTIFAVVLAVVIVVAFATTLHGVAIIFFPPNRTKRTILVSARQLVAPKMGGRVGTPAPLEFGAGLPTPPSPRPSGLPAATIQAVPGAGRPDGRPRGGVGRPAPNRADRDGELVDPRHVVGVGSHHRERRATDGIKGNGPLGSFVPGDSLAPGGARVVPRPAGSTVALPGLGFSFRCGTDRQSRG